MKDSRFRVSAINQTPQPQQSAYVSMHQCYCEDDAFQEVLKMSKSEQWFGEMLVKHLLAGGRGHYGCYSEDTEVLTSTGLKAWDKVNKQDKLLAVDITNQTAKFEYPTAIYSFDFKAGDKMYSVQSKYLDFKVTLDHRMVVSHRKSNGKFTDWYFTSAESVLNKPVRYLLSCNLLKEHRNLPEFPKDLDPIQVLKLAGFFFGDGMRSKNSKPVSIRFRLKLERKINYLRSLGFSLKEGKGYRYTLFNEDLANWLYPNFVNDLGKTVPKWLLTLPLEYIEAFWDGLKNSDGTNISGSSWSYDSCSKESLDIIQATAHINGLSANLTLNGASKKPEHKDCWRLTFTDNITKQVESCYNRSPGVTENLQEYFGKVYCATVSTGSLLVRKNSKVIVSGNCLENNSISFSVIGFPHSVMQQARTHRVGVTFDCQSLRYTSLRFVQYPEKYSLEDLVYLRPTGKYKDRQGNFYEYTQDQRQEDLAIAELCVRHYRKNIEAGFAPEHARSLLPFDIRQNFTVSFNVRSLMHFLDLRSKQDAQIEIQALCELMFPHFETWTPQVAEWYKKNRWGKAKLAP